MKPSTSIYLILGIVILALLIYWFLPSPSEAPTTVTSETITRIVSEVRAGEAVLLDVRTEQERIDDGYAEGSTHFDLARLQQGELPALDRDLTIYVYCKSGRRAEIAQEILTANGFTSVTTIGGLTDWIAAGGPVTL